MKLFLVTSILFLQISVSAQERDIKERVYLHINSSVLISGENLNYSAFIVSDKSSRLSDLSKFLYVELHGINGTVFQQKIQIESGRGAGTFFINSLMATGKYQLIAYTRWMKNFNDSFRVPLTIINPFETYQPEQSNSNEYSVNLSQNYLIAGVENEIGIEIKNRNGKPYKGEVKVVDDQGNTVSSIFTNQSGFSTLKILPGNSGNYKAVIENSQGVLNISPLNLSVKKGTILQTKNLQNGIEIATKSSENFTQEFTLTIGNSQEQLVTREMSMNSGTIINNKDLPKGLLFLSLLKGQEKITSGYYYNPPESIKDKTRTNNVYGKRTDVTETFELPSGDFSISIKKTNKYLSNNTLSSDISDIWFYLKEPNSSYLNMSLNELKKIKNIKEPVNISSEVPWLPEARNEIITGKARLENGETAADRKITFAIHGKSSEIIPFQIKTTITDENGKFLFHIKPGFTDLATSITAIDTSLLLNFEIDPQFFLQSPPFDYRLPELDSMEILEAVEKSIRNQIENAFYMADSSRLSERSWNSQIETFDFVYDFDEFKRFQNLKDHFTEYIQGASVKKGTIVINNQYAISDFNNQQLILLDGVPVNAKSILSINPLIIKYVKILNRRYFLGNQIFDGVMVIETYEGNLMGYKPGYATEITHKKVEHKLEILKSINSSDIKAQTPDQREQLFWDPEFKINDKLYKVKFHTSDVTGLFQIDIQGFSENGIPVSIKRTFEVK